MKRRGWLLYALLLAVAVVIAMAAAAGSRGRSNSPVPSVDNFGEAGTRAAFLYLTESGFDVRVARDALTPIDPAISSVVIPSPTARTLTADEVAALEAFAKAGGTVVILGRDLENAQPKLATWLGAGVGDRPNKVIADVSPKAVDPAGADAQVFLGRGALAGIDSLRVANDPTITLDRKDALPVAGKDEVVSAWWLPIGKGEVFVFSGADILQNHRIDLGGNLRFWHQLAAQGPVLFDEFHHHAATEIPLSLGVWAIIGQLLACFVVFSFVRGARLGPPRAEPPVKHRSMVEYLSSFAWLTRRARVEKELLVELQNRFRVLLQERLGVAISLPEDEVARELERQCGVSAEEYLRVARELTALTSAERVTPRQFAAVSRALARIERVVSGRA